MRHARAGEESGETVTEKRVLCDVTGCVSGLPALTVHYNYVCENDGNGHNEWNSSEIDLCHAHAVFALQHFLGFGRLQSFEDFDKGKFSAWAKSQKGPRAVKP